MDVYTLFKENIQFAKRFKFAFHSFYYFREKLYFLETEMIVHKSDLHQKPKTSFSLRRRVASPPKD